MPEDKGRLVAAFLANYFGRYVDYDFTADLEEDLDRVTTGEEDWKALLLACANVRVLRLSCTPSLRHSQQQAMARPKGEALLFCKSPR